MVSRRSSSSMDTSYVSPSGRSRGCTAGRTTNGGVRVPCPCGHSVADAGLAERARRRAVPGHRSFGAADNQPDRRAIDALAILLVLVGPVALAVRDRWPLVAVGVSRWRRRCRTSASATRTGRSSSASSSPCSPPSRPGTPGDVAAGRAPATSASSSRTLVDPDADQSTRGSLHFALVAGWLVVVLAVSELVRVAAGAGRRARARAERRSASAGVGEQRLGAGPGAARRAGPQHLADQRAGRRGPAPDRRAARAGPPGARRTSRRPAARRCTSCGPRSTSCAAARTPLDARAARWPTSTRWSRASRAERARRATRAATAPPAPLPAAVELAAYRIVQEALTNVTRHAAGHAGRRCGSAYDDAA